jgi:hypothetical protein
LETPTGVAFTVPTSGDGDAPPVDQWLVDLYRAQRCAIPKPSRIEDREDISQIGNMSRGVAGHTETIRTQLASSDDDPAEASVDGDVCHGGPSRPCL